MVFRFLARHNSAELLDLPEPYFCHRTPRIKTQSTIPKKPVTARTTLISETPRPTVPTHALAPSCVAIFLVSSQKVYKQSDTQQSTRTTDRFRQIMDIESATGILNRLTA